MKLLLAPFCAILNAGKCSQSPSVHEDSKTVSLLLKVGL